MKLIALALVFFSCGLAAAQSDKVVCVNGEKSVRIFSDAALKKSVGKVKCGEMIAVMSREGKTAYRFRYSEYVDAYVPVDRVELDAASNREPKDRNTATARKKSD